EGAAKVRTLQLAGSASGTAESAITTSSSTRAASAVTFATVAPSTGCAGSSACVTKTILMPQRTATQVGSCAAHVPEGNQLSSWLQSSRRRCGANDRNLPEGRLQTATHASLCPSRDELPHPARVLLRCLQPDRRSVVRAFAEPLGEGPVAE